MWTSVSPWLEGAAGVGDLMYIPCGSVHTLENTGDMLALGWLPTQETLGDHAGSTASKAAAEAAAAADVSTTRMAQCPNANAYEYRDGAHAAHR